jgi:ABC-2 type transport system permease protein
MLRQLLKLTWLEIKIFVREPLGLFGTVGIPVVVFVVFGRMFGSRLSAPPPRMAGFVGTELPVLAAILMTLSAVLSLITVIAIYREGGILKRLRATPLRPWMILTAHVLVKLTFTALTVILMIAAGKRYYPVDLQIPVVSFAAALILGTLGILSIGFLIASLVPTARFAQPVGTLILYPMIGLSGLFVPVASLPAALRPIARMLPLTYAVSLLSGVLKGESWTAHAGDVLALAAAFAVLTYVSARVFRWE